MHSGPAGRSEVAVFWRIGVALKPRLLVCVVAVFCLFAVSSAKADSVTVQNANFSQLGAPLSSSCGTGCAYNDGPITDWTYTGTAVAGSWQPNSSYYSSLPPGETTVTYINGGTLTQDVGTLLADTTYALTVYVGDRLDGYTTNYSFGLEAGASTLAYWSNNGQIPAGTFAPETISFTTGSAVSGDLTIFLADAGPQADFGDVSLTAVDPPPTGTPEPSSLLLLGTGLLALMFFAKRFMPARQDSAAL